MSIIVLLTSASVSMLSQCFQNTGFSCAVQVIYVFLCFINPCFCIGLSPVIYDAMWEKRRWIMILSCLSILVQAQKFSYQEIFVISGTMFISLILLNHSKRLETVERKLIETRDDSAEINALLIQKNKYLIENQDYEINLATLKERNRIAREIHDNVGHMLTRTILQVGALIIINRDENQREGLESVKNTLNSAMTSIRQSVHNLHDESVDLKKSVNEAVKSVSERFTVSCDFDFSDNIPGNVKFAVIGIIKESVSNAVKHSNGDRLYISIQEHPAFYQLVVRDNGKNGTTVFESGMGLSNMKDRVSGLDGIINFTSSEKGFKVFVTIPKSRAN